MFLCLSFTGTYEGRLLCNSDLVEPRPGHRQSTKTALGEGCALGQSNLVCLFFVLFFSFWPNGEICRSLVTSKKSGHL